ncbi:MAG TPA: septum formation initiator family protein [Candidatus Kapabacteria bacterium]|nr:septum formation initiator family protein [Candidatus Kapabacteria bacterium]HRK58198.1 septum formation initiator family protein [Candidatus Kapabacteria bacterium]
MPQRRLHSVRISAKDSTARSVEAQKQTITRKRLWIGLMIGAVVMIFVLFSRYGVMTHITLRSESAELEQKVIVLRKHNDSLRSVINTLLRDTAEIERIAREHYGFIKPGETVYILEKK